MKNIKQWFENDYHKYKITEYDDSLEAKTNIVFFLVVKPHDGTNNKWLLRVTTIIGFDRWANSTAVEMFFDTDIELCNYLYEHQLDIYEDLLEYLSSEYNDLSETIRQSYY